ncbi:hypothetical protein [Streptomyces antibioticus]|uniref:hypothetical protein n=1 Tax=Streptomyces antibioticus TaxID=1890 RepID=UPI0037002A55
MGFPEGASTITLTGRIPSPVNGTARTGRIVLTPSTVLVDRTRHAIYSGGGATDLDTDGTFSVELLCDDDPDVLPTGWRWHVDEQPAQGVRRSYWIALPSTLGDTVSLDEVAEISAPGGGSQTPPPASGTPSGPAGGALTGTYPNPDLAPATIALFDEAGSAATAQAAAATDATTKADAAQSAAAADATAKVTAHTGASDPHGDRAAATAALTTHTTATDPHGDRAYADDKFATQVALSALTGGVNDLATAVSALDTFVQDALTRVSAIENGTAFLNGVHSTGDVTVTDADLQINGDGRAYRFRRGGEVLDLEAAGKDLLVSVWSNGDFTGTQHSYDRYSADATNVQHAGRREYVASLYGAAVHTIDPITGVAALGARNALANIRLSGRRPTAGPPTTGTWDAGDTVQDSTGAWWVCTVSGEPGTWGSPAAPGNEWSPTDQGLTAWSFDPASCGASGTTLSAGFIYLVELLLRQPATINRVHAVLGAAGSGLTSGQCLAGLYDSSGARVGITADQATAWATAGNKAMALTAPYAAAAGKYYAAYLFNGTTSPSFAAGSTHGATFTPGNANLSAGAYRFCRSASGQTALPSTITLASCTPDANNLWSAAS